MKKYLFIALASLFLLLGCEQISKLTQFDFPINYELNIPALPAVNDGHTETATIKPGLKTELQRRDLGNDFLEKVILKNASIELTAPETADLSFIKSIEAYISASTTDSSEKLIAYATNISDNVGKTLPLIVESTDLKSYLLNDEVKITVKVATDKATTEQYTIKVSANFMVDVKVMGF